MRREAEENAESDRLEKERIDKLNMADSLIFQTEKQLNEFSDKLSDEDKTLINDKLVKLKEVHQSQDIDSIDVAIEDLNQTWSAVSTKMYQTTQDTTDQPQDDSAEDVDFEEVK